MISRDSVSATELGKMGLCKAAVKVRWGVARSNRSPSQYRGDTEHERFESNVNRFMRRK